MLLQGIVSDFITKNEKMLDDDSLSNGSDSNDGNQLIQKSGSILSTFRSALYRSSGRGNHDTMSLSSTSSLPAMLNGSHSLSLNDLNSFDGNSSNNIVCNDRPHRISLSPKSGVRSHCLYFCIWILMKSTLFISRFRRINKILVDLYYGAREKVDNNLTDNGSLREVSLFTYKVWQYCAQINFLIN